MFLTLERCGVRSTAVIKKKSFESSFCTKFVLKMIQIMGLTFTKKKKQFPNFTIDDAVIQIVLIWIH